MSYEQLRSRVVINGITVLAEIRATTVTSIQKFAGQHNSVSDSNVCSVLLA